MRGPPAALLLLLATGCASSGGLPPAPADAAAEAVEESPSATAEDFAAMDFRIECDSLRLTVPERLRERTTIPEEGAAGPWDLSVGSVALHVREVFPEVLFRGEDLAVVAEGIVKVRRTEGRFTTEEGPYRRLVVRNGRMLGR